MALAYDSPRWKRNSVKEFMTLWAARDFGKEVAEDVADIMDKYSVRMRKIVAKLRCTLPGSRRSCSIALYGPSRIMTSESVLEMRLTVRANIVLEQWGDLVNRSQQIYDRLPEERQPAFYELVLVPVLLQENLNRLHISGMLMVRSS